MDGIESTDKSIVSIPESIDQSYKLNNALQNIHLYSPDILLLENNNNNTETVDLKNAIIENIKNPKVIAICRAYNTVFWPVFCKYAPYFTMNLHELLNCANKSIKCFKITLMKGSNIVKNLKVTTYDGQEIITSAVIAVHTSSGTFEWDNSKKISVYRYVNFITMSGSIYYGSGSSLDEELTGIFIMMSS